MRDSERDLLMAVGRDPEDDEPRLVYADWLSTRGDPRGELIAVQCSVSPSPENDARAAALFAEHGRRWLGTLGDTNRTPPGAVGDWFERGFLKDLPYVEDVTNFDYSLSPRVIVIGEAMPSAYDVFRAQMYLMGEPMETPLVVKFYTQQQPQRLIDLLRHEARVGRLARHSNVVKSLGLARAGERFGHVTEWIDGNELYDVPQMTFADAVALVAQLCVAVEVIHSLPGQHGALNGGHVMLGYDGVVRLLGLSGVLLDGEPQPYELNNDPEAPMSPIVRDRGAMSALAPEQVAGRNVDRRCDVFSLGTILYTLACGAHPFLVPSSTGRTVFQILASIMNAEQMAPEERVPDIPPSLNQVITTAMMPEPDDRYETVAHMRLALEQVAMRERWSIDASRLVELMKRVR